jgi:hypothetical protein
MVLSLVATPYVDVRRVVPGRYFQELDRRRDLVSRTEALAAMEPPEATIYVVPRTDIHRLLLLVPGLERTEAAWAPFRRTGVALWAPGRRKGYASPVDPEERSALQASGYRLVDPDLR